MLTKNRKYKFYEIINELKNIYLHEGVKKLYQDNNWCVYSYLINVELDSDCYIGEYPKIDDISYEEKLPIFIKEKELKLIFRDELLQDVVVSALNRKGNSSNDELLKAIHYYNDNDAFLEL